MSKHLIYGSLVCGLLTVGSISLSAAEISVEMNTVSTTMSMIRLSDGQQVEVGSPTSRKYTFEAEPGEYQLTGYATDGKTVNGTIKLTITDSDEAQSFKVLTCTAYVSNKNSDGKTWQPETDYKLNVEVMSKSGEIMNTVAGQSSTAGRLTFLALAGNSYYATFTPSEEHKAEGYMALYKGATLTANSNVTGAVPLGGDYAVTVPEDAEFSLGMKFTHFTAFRTVEPQAVEMTEAGKTYKYRLAASQVYNYRTWKKDGLTYAGYFTMNTDPEKCPQLSFADEDYAAFSPKQVNHSVESNDGYETGDIFVNINPEGYLRLKAGETFQAHAMRSWELTDSAVGNYFMEPDFHYTVINPDGTPSEGVLEIENGDTTTNPWTTLKAVGEGTVIVLVTYDAIAVDYYSGVTKKPYMGGEIWGAIWPENTAAYVVTVGGEESKAVANMIVNEEYNKDTSKLAGRYLDSECDVLYYAADSEGAKFSFTPEATEEVTIARPVIENGKMTFAGYTSEGIEKSEDGEYTVTFTEGRNILRLTDADGNSTYQVVTAKPYTLTISNETAPERTNIYPGDKVKLQFEGLRHPANKLAGIYNMSAYVTFNGVPNGTSLILGSNQYKFGSTPAAQAVTFTIPEDYDIDANPEWILSEGCIQINGFGDPIGSHRDISASVGRSANFTAIAHKTYLGHVPDVVIPVTSILSGIQRSETEAEIQSIYGADGIVRNALARGLNIVTYTNGQVKKIMINN